MNKDIFKQYKNFADQNIERVGIKKESLNKEKDKPEEESDTVIPLSLESFFSKITEEQQTYDDTLIAVNWMNLRNSKLLLTYFEFIGGYSIFVRLSNTNFNKDYLVRFADALMTSNISITTKKMEEDVAKTKLNIQNIKDNLITHNSR